MPQIRDRSDGQTGAAQYCELVLCVTDERRDAEMIDDAAGAGGAHDLNEAGQPDRRGHAGSGQACACQLERSLPALLRRNGKPQIKRAEQQHKQRRHIAEIKAAEHNQAEYREEHQRLLLLEQTFHAQQQKRQERHHIQPHDILIIEKAVAAAAVHHAEQDLKPGGELPVMLPEPERRCTGAERELDNHQQPDKIIGAEVCQEDQKRERVAQEKEKDTVKLHSAGVQRSIAEPFAACCSFPELYQKRDALLHHIAPDNGFGAERIDAVQRKQQHEQNACQHCGRKCTGESSAACLIHL